MSFSNERTWLNGTYHLSAKHLTRYVREWNYRFNRRKRIFDLADFVLAPRHDPTDLLDTSSINIKLTFGDTRAPTYAEV